MDGVPVTGVTATGSNKSLPIGDNGVATTLDVKTDGADWDEGGVSSRVGIIGGTTAGRDHFPFPVLDLSSLGATPFHYVNNTPLTLVQACEMYFRVKKWRVTATGTGMADGSIYTFDREIDSVVIGEAINISEEDPPTEYETEDHRPLTLESDLVAYNSTFSRRFTSGTGTEWPISIAIPIFSYFYYDGISFYPSVDIEIDIYLRTMQGAPFSASGPFSIILGSGTITDSDGTYKQGPSAYAASSSIEAIEYWPYAYKNGDPVYDTETGETIDYGDGRSIISD